MRLPEKRLYEIIRALPHREVRFKQAAGHGMTPACRAESVQADVRLPRTNLKKSAREMANACWLPIERPLGILGKTNCGFL
jgi:hypothetical protein